jgi:hypothetical protein
MGSRPVVFRKVYPGSSLFIVVPWLFWGFINLTPEVKNWVIKITSHFEKGGLRGIWGMKPPLNG